MIGSRTLEAADYPLLAAVVLLPWAFGGVETWAYRTAALLIAASVAILVRFAPASVCGGRVRGG